MSAALSEDGTGILARSSIKDGGWFDVQFAKLYREQGGGFRQEMVQTFAVAVISIMWDIMVPALGNICILKESGTIAIPTD